MFEAFGESKGVIVSVKVRLPIAETVPEVERGVNWPRLNVAVLIPCYNEALTIGGVVSRFREALPTAKIYVYDNNSSDGTVEIAKTAGAIVRSERRQGKGFVVRRMFADIEADIFVMVDGDDTYDASVAPTLVTVLATQGLDMVSGARVEKNKGAYRAGHKFGNWMLSSIVRKVFGNEYRDMLSGYRVFSKRFVKSFPVMSAGFEIETELTVHALGLEMPSVEVSTMLVNRPAGSESKLHTLSDGFRILWTILKLLKQERPVQLFGIGGLVLGTTSIVLAYPVMTTFMETGLVPRLPTAILATGLMLLAFLSIACGLILDTVTRGRLETKRMFYLSQPGILATLQSIGNTEVDAAPSEA
jgi:hypothetical protein